jgi:hypothetical protein
MIEIMSGFPDDVLAISGKGEITADDYQTVLVPAINTRIEKHGTVRVLYLLGPDYKGFSAGAAWSDTKLGLSHWNQFSRIAVVTDVTWLKEAIRMFALFFHHPVRVFPYAELEDARKWIVANDKTT